MKKIILVLCFAFFLCGCEKTGPEYLVSGMGFDSFDGRYEICFETIVINTETTEQSVRLLKGNGSTVYEAVSQIDRQCTQPLLLSHCGILAIGDSITETELKQIGDYCYSQDELTLSVYLIRTPDAEKLFKAKPISSICAGYDIMGLLKENSGYKNRFFEVLNSGYKAALPKISLKDGGLIFNGQ